MVEMRRKVSRNQITKGLISHRKSLNVILNAMGRFWNGGVMSLTFVFKRSLWLSYREARRVVE